MLRNERNHIIDDLLPVRGLLNEIMARVLLSHEYTELYTQCRTEGRTGYEMNRFSSAGSGSLSYRACAASCDVTWTRVNSVRFSQSSFWMRSVGKMDVYLVAGAVENQHLSQEDE